MVSDASVIPKNVRRLPAIVYFHLLPPSEVALPFAGVVAHWKGTYFQSSVLALLFVMTPMCIYTSLEKLRSPWLPLVASTVISRVCAGSFSFGKDGVQVRSCACEFTAHTLHTRSSSNLFISEFSAAKIGEYVLLTHYGRKISPGTPVSKKSSAVLPRTGEPVFAAPKQK